MFQPARIGSLELVNRVVVSPMDMYVAVDGLASDFHLVHLGGKALGGAGLVMTEMVCVSAEGRITPGCAGLWNDEQQASLRRVTDFVHTNTAAQDRPPARPLRRQGLDEADVGGHRPAARRGQLAGRRPVTGALPRGRQPGAPRADPRRDGHDPRRVRRLRPPRRRGRLRPARAALRPRLPALRVPLPGDQPADRRVRRRRRTAGCATRSRCSPRSARCGRRTGR